MFFFFLFVGYHADLPVLPHAFRTGGSADLSVPGVHNWVNGRNVTQAHRLLEDARLGPHADRVAGRPFMVSDAGPPLRFQDVYDVLATTSATGMRVDHQIGRAHV